MKWRNLNVAVLALMVGKCAIAQNMMATPEQLKNMGAVTGPEVQAALKKVWDHLGYGDVKTMEYHGKGNGMVAAPGQTYSWIDDMPRFRVNNFVRTTNFETGQSCDEYTKEQGPYPPHGGGGTPLVGKQTWKSCLVGDYAWDVVDGKVIPQANGHLYGSSEADFRKLDAIYGNPVGFLKAAMAKDANPSMLTSEAARSAAHRAGNVRAVALQVLGKYRVVGMLSDDDTVEGIFTWIGNPVVGQLDMQYRYTTYRMFNGKPFPTNLHIHQGDGGISFSHNSADHNTGDVKWNTPVTTIVVPDEVKNAKSTVASVVSQKLADGVWLIGGSDLNSVAVEFKNFVSVFEAPMNEQRSIAVIAEIKKLIPNKPIRYVVNSSWQWDNSGGLRTYYTRGATVVTSEYNKDYYDKILFNFAPLRPLMEDRYSYFYISPGGARAFNAQYVQNRNYTITDGDQTMEIIGVQGPLWFSTEEKELDLSTATRDIKQFPVVGTLVAYLPKSGILISADLYKPEKPGDAPPPGDNNMTLLLAAAKARGNGAVKQIVSIDSPYVATVPQLEKAVATAPKGPPGEDER